MDAHAFGFCYALAFAAGWLVLVFEGRRQRRPGTAWLVLVVWSMLCGIAGSRLGVIPLSDWAEALSRGAIPTTSHKTFLGLVIAGVAGVHLGRKWLRLPRGVADAFALALPAGLAIARIGCVLGGCCFGTPAHLPWAIAYGPGSVAYQVQLGRGLIPAGAAHALPVHPVQLYEVGLLALVIAALLAVRPRLRRPGSLFLLYLALQALVRFLIEFVREGQTETRLLGLRPLQLVLPAVAAGAGLWLWLYERRAARPAEATSAGPGGAGLGRAGVLLAASAAFLVFFQRWFTPVEQFVIFLTGFPALVAVGLAVARRAASGSTRWAAVATMSAAMILLGAGSDSLPPLNRHVEYYNGSISGGTGGYVEICGEPRTYRGFGVTMSRTDRWSRFNKVEWGLHGVYLRDWPTYGGYGTGFYSLGAGLFVRGDSRWIGAGLGGRAWWYVDSGGHYGQPHILPAGSLRVGPSDIVYLEAHGLDWDPTLYSVGRIGIGTNAIEDLPVRIGLSAAGFYVNVERLARRGFSLDGLAAFGGVNYWHLGLKLTYSIDARNRPAWLVYGRAPR